jgi:polysaccharide biosynthesis protein PslF
VIRGQGEHALRVLVISPTFPPTRSGGADYAFRLCQELAARGLDIHVVTTALPEVVRDPRFVVSPIMRRWSWSEMPRLLRAIRRFSPDVIDIHFHGRLYHDQPMITLLPGLLKRAARPPRIVTHVEYPTGVRPDRTLLTTRALRKAMVWWLGAAPVDWAYGALLTESDRLIVLSAVHRATLAERFEPASAKAVLIPPPPLMRLSPDRGGQARRETRRALGVADDECLLAYFGYLYPGKGVETLLQAMSLDGSRPGRTAKAVIIGGANEVVLRDLDRPNYPEELRRLAVALGVARRLTWTGYYASDSDIASRYLAAADVAVLPFGAGAYLNNSSIAAAAVHALPIVTTRGSDVEEAFRDGQNLLFVPPGDAPALAEAIRAVRGDAVLRERLRTGAADLAATWFSWEAALDRTIEVFESRD